MANAENPGDSLSDLYSQFSDFTNMLQSDFDISLPFLQNPQQRQLINTLMGKDIVDPDFTLSDPGKDSTLRQGTTRDVAIMIPLFSIGIASGRMHFSRRVFRGVAVCGNI